MYIKVNNDVIENYPYTIGNLRKDNPQVSFPAIIPDSLLAEYGVYPVKPSKKPSYNVAKIIKEGVPERIDGVWTQVWVEEFASYEEHLAAVLAKRQEEYPPMTDYIDGVVKGDQEQMQRYIEACLAVKLKYPKP